MLASHVDADALRDALTRFVFDLETVIGNAHCDAFPLVAAIPHCSLARACAYSESQTDTSSSNSSDALRAFSVNMVADDAESFPSAPAAVHASAKHGCSVKQLRRAQRLFSAVALKRHHQTLAIALLVSARLSAWLSPPLVLQTNVEAENVDGQPANPSSSSSSSQFVASDSTLPLVSSTLLSAVVLAMTVGARFLDPLFAIDIAPPAPKMPVSSTEASDAVGMDTAVRSNNSGNESNPLESVVPATNAAWNDSATISASGAISTCGADVSLWMCATAVAEQLPSVMPVNASASLQSAFESSAVPQDQSAQQQQQLEFSVDRAILHNAYRFAALIVSAHRVVAANQSCRHSAIEGDRRVLRLLSAVWLHHPVVRAGFCARFDDVAALRRGGVDSGLVSTSAPFTDRLRLALSECYFRELSRCLHCAYDLEIRATVADLSDLAPSATVPSTSSSSSSSSSSPPAVLLNAAIFNYHHPHEFCAMTRLPAHCRGISGGIIQPADFDISQTRGVVDAALRNSDYVAMRRARVIALGFEIERSDCDAVAESSNETERQLRVLLGVPQDDSAALSLANPTHSHASAPAAANRRMPLSAAWLGQLARHARANDEFAVHVLHLLHTLEDNTDNVAAAATVKTVAGGGAVVKRVTRAEAVSSYLELIAKPNAPAGAFNNQPPTASSSFSSSSSASSLSSNGPSSIEALSHAIMSRASIDSELLSVWRCWRRGLTAIGAFQLVGSTAPIVTRVGGGLRHWWFAEKEKEKDNASAHVIVLDGATSATAAKKRKADDMNLGPSSTTSSIPSNSSSATSLSIFSSSSSSSSAALSSSSSTQSASTDLEALSKAERVAAKRARVAAAIAAASSSSASAAASVPSEGQSSVMMTDANPGASALDCESAESTKLAVAPLSNGTMAASDSVSAPIAASKKKEKEEKKKSSNAVIEQEAADSVLKLQHASLQHFYRYVTH